MILSDLAYSYNISAQGICDFDRTFEVTAAAATGDAVAATTGNAAATATGDAAATATRDVAATATGNAAAVDAATATSDISLRDYQLLCLNQTLAHAHQNSSYYRELLGGQMPPRLVTLAELTAIATTDSSALGSEFGSLLAVSQAQVARIVTLFTSGSTGEAKRVAFSAADQQATVRYFAAGMRMLAKAGEHIAVLFPCETTGSLGALLLDACKMMGAIPLGIGIPKDFASLSAALQSLPRLAMVGFPQHILAFARWCEHNDIMLRVGAVLLSADNIAASLRSEISRIWNCAVFEHYGLTEAGYGLAVSCPNNSGMHIRETDLIVEICDPQTGESVRDGEWGEVAITTLTRQAMPLIRYRTGDISRLMLGKCGCGSPLRRLDAIWARVDSGVEVKLPAQMILRLFEEQLFALPGLLDFRLEFFSDSGEFLVTLQMLPGVQAYRELPDAKSLVADLQRVLTEAKKVSMFNDASLETITKVCYQIQTENEFKPFCQAKRVLIIR